MFTTFEDHFLWRARLLMAGRYDDLARHYVFPLLADMAGHRLVVEDAAGLVVHLHRYRMALRENAVLALVPRILAVDLPRAGNRVWVRWLQKTDKGLLPEWADVVYDMDHTDGWLRIRSMHYSRLMLDEFRRPATHRRLVRAAESRGK